MRKPDIEGPITSAELGSISMADQGQSHGTFILPTLYGGGGGGGKASSF